MRKKRKKLPPTAPGLAKCPTGIAGLDDITGGGFPRGHTTLICGGAGCGKTVLATEFLVRGATEYGEPGVFMGFEENTADLAANVASLGFNLNALAARKKLALDYVYIDRNEIEETGEYDLEGLFVRLNQAIESVKARRVVLDTLEALFAGLSNTGILRAELRRLFRWLKEKGLTAVVTGERGNEGLTRHGLEEYVSDCVILLDHRVQEQVVTRRLRVVKYRGTSHGTNEYPFLLDEHGLTLVPITSLKLEGRAPAERVSTGVPQLDDMMGGKGYYRGSTVLVTGGAGAAKTSMACHFVDAACRRGERALFFSTEEPAPQILRNMRSIGLHLDRWVKKGLLRFCCVRPTSVGFEMYLSRMYRALKEYNPRVVVVDPVTGFESGGTRDGATALLTRLVDFVKTYGSTGLFTSLTGAGDAPETSESGISSAIDTWLLLRNLEVSGERRRSLYILKSRGMAHSNRVREFELTSRGIELKEIARGPAALPPPAELGARPD